MEKSNYGIFKFKIPSKDERKNALNLAGDSTLFKKLISSNIDSFYEPIQEPQDGDWLMMHKEFGQTYEEFARQSTNLVTKDKYVIYLVSLSFSENGLMNEEFITSLKIMTEAYYYGMKTVLLHKTYDLNKYKIKTMMNIESGKIQICSNQILGLLNNEIPKNAYCVIAFTDQDLFIDSGSNEQEVDTIDKTNNEDKINEEEENQINEGDEEEMENIEISNTFTFGLSFPKLRLSLFSFARYDPVFYTNQSDDNKNEDGVIEKYFSILLKRSCKVLVKEIALIMGLKNCIYYKCAFNGFYTMEEFDNKPLELCPICLKKVYVKITNREGKLNRMVNSTIIFDRWVKMKDTLEDYFTGLFEEEIQWYDSRIELLKDEV